MRTDVHRRLIQLAAAMAIIAVVAIVAVSITSQGRERNAAVWNALPDGVGSNGLLAGSGYALIRSETAVSGGAAGWETSIRGGGSPVLSRLLDAGEPIDGVLVGDCHNSDALVLHATPEGAAVSPDPVRHACDGTVSVSHFTLDPGTIKGEARGMELLGQLDGGVGDRVMRYMILMAQDGAVQIPDDDLITLFLATVGGPLFLD